jgi:pyruvate/2-oxoglutarate dehydrogenase complex dihydrolipoamide acyltransferase (E2) component
MALNILMPESMAGGTLARWLKQVGDRIAKGEIVAEIETDKASMEVESPSDGVLKEVLVPEGSAGVPADVVLAVLISGSDR